MRTARVPRSRWWAPTSADRRAHVTAHPSPAAAAILCGSALRGRVRPTPCRPELKPSFAPPSSSPSWGCPFVGAGLAGQSLAQGGRDVGADRFDGLHQLRMGQRGRVHLKADALDTAQRFTVTKDLLDHRFGVADQQGAVRAQLIVEISAGDPPPSPLLRDRVDGAGKSGEKLVGGLLGRGCNIARGVDADSQSIGTEPGSLAGFAVEIHEGPEPPRLACDDVV